MLATELGFAHSFLRGDGTDAVGRSFVLGSNLGDALALSFGKACHPPFQNSYAVSVIIAFLDGLRSKNEVGTQPHAESPKYEADQ